jgi:predicted metal-dependent peptidase
MTDKLTKAKTQVILHHPFIASILLRHDIQLTDRVPTAGIDRDGNIFVNPQFAESLSVQQLVFLLWHEAFHRLKMTHIRQEWRDARLWNIAEDAVINETLIADNIGEFIPSAVRYPGADTMSGEKVYEELQQQQQGGSGGKPGQQTPGDDEGWGIGEDVMDEGQPLTETERRIMEEEIKQEIASAAQAAKAQGKMPGGIGRLVDEILNPKISYREILERWMTQRAKNDYSWARPNRRYVAQGIYMPSLDGIGMGEIAVIIDTSGSVSSHELKHFWGSIRQIFEDVHPTAVHIVNVDSQVSGVHTLTELP